MDVAISDCEDERGSFEFVFSDGFGALVNKVLDCFSVTHLCSLM